MTISMTWFDGHRSYIKRTLEIDPYNNKHTFTSELLDVETNDLTDINDILAEHLSVGRTVEVLYSGGLDSECVLKICLNKKIPAKAVTMRLLVKGYPINTHDLYYSEKFCRTNNVEQILVDLNVDKFFENGDHYAYLAPYYITEPHVATHFWLFEQCSSFPVLGGDYSWPWTNRSRLSPHRHLYACNDLFLKHKGIDGIGNTLNYSLESNLAFMKKHLEILRDNPSIETDNVNIPIFKQLLMKKMNVGDFETRMRSYGWEVTYLINKRMYREALTAKFSDTKNYIKWNKKVANVIGGDPDINDKFNDDES